LFHLVKITNISLTTSIIVYLDIFPLCFIIEHMGHVSGWDLFSSCSSVYTHHSYTNRPGSISYSHF